jgi:molybdenum cofactor guanylyltransferase
LPDEWNGVGPLGGIATCLSRTRNALLLVLAIDLPQIQPGFLKKLLARSEAGCGVVPIYNNRFEPLIAIYPRAALGAAIEQLSQKDYVLQHLVDKLLEQGQLKNWNTPGDLG